MSSPRSHLIQGAVWSTALYPVIGDNAVVVGVSSILIDVDHVLQYVWDTGSLNPQGFFPYFEMLKKRSHYDYFSICIFHTIEFYGLLAIIGYFIPVFWYVLAGCLLHHLSDSITLYRNGILFCRAFSFVEWAVRRKNGKYAQSLFQLIQNAGEKAPLSDDDRKWLTCWGFLENQTAD
ncbi:MAG: hypothetical protein HY537_08930 [Deltaproteobacteria bacterium]|nr:hypothetical protein [Deltaproteobacteria bacterium]